MIGDVEISFRAQSKVGRYYGPAAIREKLDTLDGTLFQREDGMFYLRTIKPTHTGPPKRVVIVFEVTESTAYVITQTSDHYNWSNFVNLDDPPFSIDLPRNDE
ncbi:hypothetical protein [Natrinema caseinilyticum]|uniref:hypothetical protein n=1 Tax=Natrinema caseinilyticum TaxID=2961570 RepID=UPI0020C380EA|nr:hypothetical protein [Natrinema caseinilyticum]